MKHHQERHYDRRRSRSLTDRRIRDKIDDLDFLDRRVNKEDRRSLLQTIKSFFDRRIETKPVAYDRRQNDRRSAPRRQLKDRRVKDIPVAEERRIAARRAEEIARLIELEPSVSKFLAPYEVEKELKDLNRS